MSPDVVINVILESDGTCMVDGEFLPVPAGAALPTVVLAHLQMEAAARAAPVYAVIHNRGQDDEPLPLTVQPSGASEPWQDYPRLPDPASATSAARWDDLPDIPLARPWSVLPEPYAETLEDICRRARSDNLRECAAAADRLLAELTDVFGADHWRTLVPGHVRGDLAFLSGDLSRGAKTFIYTTQQWQQSAGTTHPMAQVSLRNALGCWLRLPSDEARTLGDTIVGLLETAGHQDARVARARLSRLNVI
ncbi:hypothetical protein AB0M58_14345 [Streptomyces bobili]|uniref:hypothetical protein n=1 Tax=Streptomyces bobili TaxID=67280 RepID=UPI00343FF002